MKKMKLCMAMIMSDLTIYVLSNLISHWITIDSLQTKHRINNTMVGGLS